MLILAPKIRLSAANIILKTTPSISPSLLKEGCILYLENVQEAAMQPFLPTSAVVSRQGPDEYGDFLLQQGKKFQVSVFRDRFGVSQGGPGLAEIDYGATTATEEILLGDEVWVDSESITRDPFKRPSQMVKWREEFDKIGKELE